MIGLQILLLKFISWRDLVEMGLDVGHGPELWLELDGGDGAAIVVSLTFQCLYSR